MATPFAHTLGSLERTSSVGGRALLVLAPLLLVAWVIWLFAAEVEVIETSGDAQVRAAAASRPLAAAQAGRIARVRVDLGARVDAGEVLLELDDREVRIELARAEVRLEAVDAVIAQRAREIEAERGALEAAERAAGAAASEARARVDAAVAEARLAQSKLDESRALDLAEATTRSELRESEAEAARRQAAARELRSAGRRERFEAARQSHDRLAKITAIEAQVGALEIDREDARGQIAALEAELERLRVRAPVAGVVGELAAVERGAWVERGQQLGVIVPDGGLEVVATFSPAQAVGRIRPGQAAVVRLLGFPWAEFGSVQARVEGVASEPRGGAIVVELGIVEVPPTIVLEHGLPASVEVSIERTTPASLLLRTAGQRLAAQAGEAAPAPVDPAAGSLTADAQGASGR
ncbi:MAG: HlyD family efflux transporter periplasmic adaptor subunit [Nannocystaceae bacterium]